jgi:streptomycin 6-kinase
VLKVQFPDRESEYEAAALEHWGGLGAVRLLAWDPERRALLLERCLPGTPLADTDPDFALGVLTQLVDRLSIPAGSPFRTLADEASHWAAHLEDSWRRAGRPFERSLVDIALSYLERLPFSQGDVVLLNQDLHARNVLRARREPWLVIDPKPLVGERAFAVASIVRDSALGLTKQRVHARLERLVRALDLDRERAIGWTVAQTIAWSITPEGALPGHLDTVRWILELRGSGS